MKLLFCCSYSKQKRKHGEMAFLTSSSVSKHVLFALGVDHTARDTVKVGVRPSLTSYTGFAVS